jgi:uncharacterized protein
VKPIHEKSGLVLGSNIKVACGFQKMRGLMFARDFGGHDGIFFSWRNSVHNCFVRFPIDLIFITKDAVVVKVVRRFQPWRFSWIYFRARHVIELPASAVPESVAEGDQLEIIQ